jgi:O-antigen/teichoic acid export membrane protein
MHHGALKYLTNSVWLLIGRGYQMFIALLVGVWVARYLGPKEYGLLSYCMSFVGLFSFLSILGLDSIIIKEISARRFDPAEVMGTALTLKLMGGGIAIALASLVGLYFEGAGRNTVLIFICSLSFLFQAGQLTSLYFESSVKQRYITIGYVIQLSLMAAVRWFLIYSEASVLLFGICFVLDAVVFTVVEDGFYRKVTGRKLYWCFNRKMAVELFRQSWPLLISSIAILIYQRINQVMLKNICTEESVGYFAAAERITQIGFFFPALLSRSFMPALISAKGISGVLYQKRVQSLFDLLTWSGIAIAAVLALLAPWLVRFLYGEEYLQAVPVLRVSAWTGVFIALGTSSGVWIVVEGLQKYAPMRNIAGAIINVALNFLFIPRWGALGAAYATLIAYSTASYFSHVLTKALRPVFKLQTKSLLLGWRNLLVDIRLYLNKGGMG